MSSHIETKCPECGNSIQVPESAAGSMARCAACGAAVPVPEQVYDAEEILPSRDLNEWDSAGDERPLDQRDEADWPAARPSSEPDDKERRPCPMCGEMIVASAAKCRYCGEVFEPALGRPYSRPGAWDSGGEMTGLDWVLCVLCPGIGCIVGIVACVRGDSTRGGKMIAFGLLFGVFWNIVRIAVENMNP